MISDEHSSGSLDLLAHEEVEPLIEALDDSEAAARIAVLRALLRLRAYLDRRAIEEIRSHAQSDLNRLVELEFITYLPSDEALSRFLRDLQWSQEVVNEYPIPQDY